MILDALLGQHFVDGDHAAILAAATLWLAATGPHQMGSHIGDLYKAVHYEISNITGADGRKGTNFRLVLGQDADEPLPEVVFTAPSPYDTPPKDEGEER